MADNKAETLTDATIGALDRGLDQVKPADGVALLKDWIGMLKGGAATSGIAGDLQTLHDELQSSDPDGLKISEIMEKLGMSTKDAAGSATKDSQDSLKTLADSLSKSAQSLKSK